MYKHITFTTDFSEASHTAFLHALALALRFKAVLDIMHVRDPGEDNHMLEFPHVRATLEQWGVSGLPSVLGPNTSVAGLTINKIEVASKDAVASLAHYARKRGSELVVAASHGRLGLKRILHGSLTEELAKQSSLPLLLFGPEAKPFIAQQDGTIFIRRVVLPLAAQPAPGPAYDELVQLLAGETAEVLPLHVRDGGTAFDDGHYEGRAIRFANGNPANAITSYCKDGAADLVVMATEGAHGLKETMFGSTTSHVLAHAPCPVLAVPA